MLDKKTICSVTWVESNDQIDNCLNDRQTNLYIYIHICTSSFLSWGIILWIELLWPENRANTCVQHMETLDSCFNLIRSNQQCIPCFPHWRSNQQPQNMEQKFYHIAISPHHAQVIPNQLVMAIECPGKLNVSCKLHPYSLQRTWSSWGPHLLRSIGNTHPLDYYNLKGKDIDVHFLFKVEKLYCEFNSLYIYIYILSSIDRLFHCITTHQCSWTCEMLQSGIEPGKLCQPDNILHSNQLS